MHVSVFGIGYVGAVTAGCLTAQGHHVVAVDMNPSKVEMINRGLAPIVEPGLDQLIKDGVEARRLQATTDARMAIANSVLSIICVGTPSLPNGNLDLSHVAAVCEEIGRALKEKDKFHSIVLRSTMLPGSMRETVIPVLERVSGKRAGKDFGIAIYPEFLRESTAIKDYLNPAAIIIGVMDDETLARLREMNIALQAPELVVDLSAAEAIKYANNCWHAVKITFANEIGNICRQLGIDGHQVMNALCADTRLNISPAYLKPGMAFGGSCLPKDLRALRYRAKSVDVKTPLLDATSDSNALQIDRAFQMIAAGGKKRVGMLGLSFKSGTDDLRESPLVEVAERLYGKGYDLRIYDRNVRYAALTGSNLHYVRSHLPHLSALIVDDIGKVWDHAEIIVVGNADPEFKDAANRAKPEQQVVDFVRIEPTLRSAQNYQGLCW